LTAGEQLFTRRRGPFTERSHGLLARRAVRVASPAKPRGVAHHARQPRPHRPREIRWPAQRRDPRVLHDIIGERTIADQAGREAPQPGRMFEQHLGRAHVLFMQRGDERWPECDSSFPVRRAEAEIASLAMAASPIRLEAKSDICDLTDLALRAEHDDRRQLALIRLHEPAQGS
jgi:hypothetical protein